MNSLNISRLHFPVTTLGPGKRIGIWFQGCSIRCPGCISTDTWPASGKTTYIHQLVEGITQWLPETRGITITGGEPFDQPEGLIDLVTLLKKTVSCDLLIYSGYPFNKIKRTLSKIDGLVDAVISEPFIAGESQTYPLRGSDNQKLHLLTALGQKRFKNFVNPQTTKTQKLDVMFDTDGSVWFVGIPKQKDFIQLQQLLKKQGHSIRTTEQRILKPGNSK